MDNQTHNAEDAWVENKLFTLVPPSDWHPDSKRAYAQLLNRRESHGAEASPRWIRLSMVAAILASIGLVVTLLPWHALWRPAASSKSKQSETVKAATPAPPIQPQPPAVPPTQQREQKSAEKSGFGESPSAGEREPQFSDPARRAHILGTLAAVQQTPSPAPPEQEQIPPERIGPGVTPPRIIGTAPEPNYTDEARQLHIQGTVILDVTVRVDGTGKVNKVVRAVGYGLDEMAVEAFEKWRFVPGSKDGKPVDVQLQVTINFHLY